jgi:hypothetical protein
MILRALMLLVLINACTLSAWAAPNPGRDHQDRGQVSVHVEGDMLRLRLPSGLPAQHPMVEMLPRSSQAWLDQMLDTTRNGAAFKDPQAFVEWLDAITEPQFMTALATASISPDKYHRALSALVRPETARNWAEFTNPLLYLRWMLTGTQPDFYNAIIERLAEPGKAKRWAQFGIQPDATLSMRKAGQPEQIQKSLAASGPEMLEPMATLASPGTYLAWLANFADAAIHPRDPRAEWRQLPALSATDKAAPRYRY